MSSSIYKINKPKFRGKLASFDYDWTIVNPKGGKTFPVNINDWEWYHPSVPDKIKEYYGWEIYNNRKFQQASEMFSKMISNDVLDEFLTLPAYQYI